MKDTRITCHRFPTKEVYIFSDHAVALKAWARVRVRLGTEPILFTMDHHTDLHEAFASFGYGAENRTGKSKSQIVKEILANIDISDATTVDKALQMLKHDEHIYAALDLGIIDRAIVLTDHSARGPGTLSDEEEATEQHNRSSDVLSGRLEPLTVPPRPHRYWSAYKVFELPNPCAIGCVEDRHDSDECYRRLADQAIEGVLLRTQTVRCDDMLVSVGHLFSRKKCFLLYRAFRLRDGFHRSSGSRNELQPAIKIPAYKI